MSSLRNLGRYPDQDAALSSKLYVDTRFTESNVSLAQVDAMIADKTQYMTTKTYVDTQDALYGTKTYVDTQDALYVANSSIGAANGVAPLDSGGKVPAANLPTFAAQVPVIYNKYSTADFSNSGSLTTGTATLGTVAVADPGYAYRLWCFGYFEGRSEAGDSVATVEVINGAETWGHGYGVWANSGLWNPICIAPHPNVADGTSNPAGLTGARTLTVRAKRSAGNGSIYVTNYQASLTVLVFPVG